MGVAIGNMIEPFVNREFHMRHAQFNRKSAIFGLQIGSFQGRSFPTAGQRNEDAGYEGDKHIRMTGYVIKPDTKSRLKVLH